MRYHRKLVESQATERNRLLKVLETTNIKLSSVVTDVFGVSGRLVLHALTQGEATPQEMAELAKGLLRKKIPQLEPALEGKLEEHIVSCSVFSYADSRPPKRIEPLWSNASGRS